MSELTKKGDFTNVKNVLKKVIGFLFAILVPAAVIMALMPEFLVTIFFGEKFIEAAPLIPLMAGGTIFGTIFYVLASVFNGADMTRIPATIAAFAILFAITGNIIFLPTYGIMATAMIFSATSAFMGITALCITYTRFLKN